MLFNVWGLIWPNQKRVLGLVDATDEEKATAKRVGIFSFSYKHGLIYSHVAFYARFGKRTTVLKVIDQGVSLNTLVEPFAGILKY